MPMHLFQQSTINSLVPLCSRSAVGFRKFPPPTCAPHVQNVQHAKQSGHIQYDPGLPSYIIPVIIFNIVVCVHACIHGHMHSDAPRGHTAKSTPLVFHLVQPRHHAMTFNININLLHIGSTTFIFFVCFYFQCREAGRNTSISCQTLPVIGDILKHKRRGIKALSLDYH